MSYPIPSLKELRNQLERAERNLHCADMIDSPVRRDREKLRYQTQIDRIRAQMAEAGSDANG